MDYQDMKAVFSSGKIFSSIGKAFDIYGNSVTLTIENQDTSKSTVGTILTICTLIACFGLSWESFYNVVLETDAKLKFSSKAGTKQFEVDSNLLKFFMMLILIMILQVNQM